MQLLELQQTFVKALFDRKYLPAMSAWVETQGNLIAEQRVGIYRNSVHGILVDYLGSLFVVTQQLVGEQLFEHLSDHYIDQQPPTSPFLADYGSGFSAFLHSHPALSTVAWIAEVAALEWARHQAWHAINQAASDFSQLAELDAEQQANLRFHLPHSAQLISSSVAIHSVWLAHQAEDHADKLPLESIQLATAESVLVWRSGRRLHQQLLTPVQTRFLQALQQARLLTQLTESFAEQLPALMSHAFQQGWILSYDCQALSPH